MLQSFAKLHGLGNDFLVFDLRGAKDTSWFDDGPTIRALCDRHRGVGGDGVLGIFDPSLQTLPAIARMRVRNADGSEAEMCGNGLRCVASWLFKRGADASLSIETAAGILRCDVDDDGRSVQVDMGAPRPLADSASTPAKGFSPDSCRPTPVLIDGLSLPLYRVSMGNPHAVVFVEQLKCSEDERDVWRLAERLGPHVETHALFPQRTNVEFVAQDGPNAFTAVVWERGCGITQACGTGACAVVVAACARGLTQPGHSVRVRLPGGALEICVQGDYGQVRMRGPVAYVFDGALHLAAGEQAR